MARLECVGAFAPDLFCYEVEAEGEVGEESVGLDGGWGVGVIGGVGLPGLFYHGRLSLADRRSAARFAVQSFCETKHECPFSLPPSLPPKSLDDEGLASAPSLMQQTSELKCSLCLLFVCLCCCSPPHPSTHPSSR